MTQFNSARLEYHTIFERVPKWSSWGILVEWFDGRGYHAEWFEQCTLGLDGAEDYEVPAYSGSHGRTNSSTLAFT